MGLLQAAGKQKQAENILGPGCTEPTQVLALNGQKNPVETQAGAACPQLLPEGERQG